MPIHKRRSIMDLAIDTTDIVEIMLSDGIWYNVYNMIIVDYSYGYSDGDVKTVEYQSNTKGFEADIDTTVRSTAVMTTICGPMSSIVAVKLREQRHADLKEK